MKIYLIKNDSQYIQDDTINLTKEQIEKLNQSELELEEEWLTKIQKE